MQILQHTIPVAPGLVAKVCVRLVSNGLISQASFTFINRTVADIDNKPVSTEPLLFSIEQSPDGLADWTVAQPEFQVAGGGQSTKVVSFAHKHVRIKGKGANGKGGYARLHLSYEGMQDMGQFDVLELGKQGFGFDGGTGQGQKVSEVPGYPEGEADQDLNGESSSSDSSGNSSSSSSDSSASSQSSLSSVNSSSSSSSSSGHSSSSSSSKSSASSNSSSSSSSTS